MVDTAGNAADGIPQTAGDVVAVAPTSLVVLREYVAVEVDPDHSVAASLTAAVPSTPLAAKPEVN